MDDLLEDVIAEAKDHLATADACLAALASRPADRAALAGALRVFHSVKGTCGFVGLDALGALAHEAETLLGEMQDGEACPERVAATRALTARCLAALGSAEQRARAARIPAADAAPPAEADGRDLIEAAVRRLPSLVAKVAAVLGKRVRLDVMVGDLVLDRRTTRLMRTALVHLVHNAVDHGIESPAERRATGKPEIGSVRVRAQETSGRIVVTVADDGRGLSTEKIATVALRQGLAKRADFAAMTEAEIQRFVFAPGLSTAPALTQISGRGIGMDVVEAAMDLLGGTVEVRSIARAGTTFTLAFTPGAVGARRGRNGTGARAA